MDINNEITRVCEAIAQMYRDTLRSQGAIASGELSNFRQTVTFDGRWFEVIFQLPEYWKYIENGTQPHWPNIDAIKRWIEVKPIVPRAQNGKVPTTNQLAFLISRKIAETGTAPRNSLETALNNSASLINKLEELITEQLINELTNDINSL